MIYLFHIKKKSPVLYLERNFANFGKNYVPFRFSIYSVIGRPYWRRV
jgi:hypothetical protein